MMSIILALYLGIINAIAGLFGYHASVPQEHHAIVQQIAVSPQSAVISGNVSTSTFLENVPPVPAIVPVSVASFTRRLPDGQDYTPSQYVAHVASITNELRTTQSLADYAEVQDWMYMVQDKISQCGQPVALSNVTADNLVQKLNDFVINSC